MDRTFIILCRRRIQYLKKLLLRTTNIHDQITIENTIKNLEEILNFKTQSNTDSNKHNSIDEEFLFLEKHSTTIEFLHAQTPSQIIIKTEPKYIKISQAHLFTLIYDFFKKILDPEMFKYFLYFFQNRKHFIHFLDKDFYAEIFLPYYKEAHIFVYKKDDWLNIFKGLCHEIGHLLVEFINSSYNSNSSLYGEIPSIIYETLCLDYLKSIPEFHDLANYELQDDFNTFCYDNQIIFLQKQVWEQFKKSSQKSIGSLPQIIQELKKQNHDSNIDFVFEGTQLLSAHSRENLMYSVSRLIGQQLFILCQTDREYYHYQLKKLINSDWQLPDKTFERNLTAQNLLPKEKSDTIKYKRMIIERKSQNF